MSSSSNHLFPSHSTASRPIASHHHIHHVPHFHHQGRAPPRRHALLLHLHARPVRRRRRLWLVARGRHPQRVRPPASPWTERDADELVSAVTLSPSARAPPRRCTSGRKSAPGASPELGAHPARTLTHRSRLLAIRQKLEQQQKHIEELTKHMCVCPVSTNTPQSTDAPQRRGHQAGGRPGRAARREQAVDVGIELHRPPIEHTGQRGKGTPDWKPDGQNLHGVL
jgi:hypothetical protein